MLDMSLKKSIAVLGATPPPMSNPRQPSLESWNLKRGLDSRMGCRFLIRRRPPRALRPSEAELANFVPTVPLRRLSSVPSWLLAIRRLTPLSRLPAAIRCPTIRPV